MTTASEFATKPEAQLIFDLIQMGRLTEARQSADVLLAQEPDNALALYLSGLVAKAQGNLAGAITLYNKALQRQPDFKRACGDLAYALQQAGQMNLAIKMYEHLIRIEQNEGKHAIQPATPLTPASKKTLDEWYEKAKTYFQRGQVQLSADAFKKALRITPNDPDMLVNLSVTLCALGRNDESEEVLMRALHISPGYAAALNQLGNSHKDRRYLVKAIAAYKLSHASNPRFRQPLANMGKTYFELQMYAEAIDAYERTLEVEPNSLEILGELAYVRQMVCRWEKLDELHERITKNIEAGTQAGEPFIVMPYANAKLQMENTMRWSKKMYPAGGKWKPAKLPALARADGRLRIGYMSSDFQRHATLALISEMFSHHDRARFEIYAYSYGVDDGGPERQRLRGLVDHFRDLYNVSDDAACEIIRQDGIDILVDLKGFTQNHRLSLMARRAAPVQMHYLGFPGSLGSDFIDYFIADSIAAPKALDACFTEKLIRMPHAYQINDRTRTLPASDGPSRADYGLPETGFVFCGFNNLYKITPSIFGVWMNLLKEIEGSVLWVLETHEESTRNLKIEAEKRGVDPARIIPAKMTGQAEHLKRYRYADLLIDTGPVCGHTTTSDALWCAVPVVTLKGESFIASVAGSLLHAVELPDLVAETLADYERIALSLAKNPQKLAKLREHLHEGRMRFTLFDSTGTTRALEAAYIHAAELQKKGEAPQTFTLAPDLSIV